MEIRSRPGTSPKAILTLWGYTYLQLPNILISGSNTKHILYTTLGRQWKPGYISVLGLTSDFPFFSDVLDVQIYYYLKVQFL